MKTCCLCNSLAFDGVDCTVKTARETTFFQREKWQEVRILGSRTKTQTSKSLFQNHRYFVCKQCYSRINPIKIFFNYIFVIAFIIFCLDIFLAMCCSYRIHQFLLFFEIFVEPGEIEDSLVKFGFPGILISLTLLYALYQFSINGRISKLAIQERWEEFFEEKYHEYDAKYSWSGYFALCRIKIRRAKGIRRFFLVVGFLFSVLLAIFYFLPMLFVKTFAYYEELTMDFVVEDTFVP